MDKESFISKTDQKEVYYKKQGRLYLLSFLIIVIALIYLIIKTNHLSTNINQASQEMIWLKEEIKALSQSNNIINYKFEHAIIQLDLREIASKYQSDLFYSNEEIDTLRKLIKKKESTKIAFDIFYKASIDGDNGESFMKSYKGNQIMLMIIKLTNRNRIAIYLRRILDGGGTKKDPRAFIYSFEQKTQYMIEEHSNITVKDYRNHFPIYGDDLLHLNDNCLSMANSYSQFKPLYNLFPKDEYSHSYNSDNRTYFEINEIECFNVSFT